MKNIVSLLLRITLGVSLALSLLVAKNNWLTYSSAVCLGITAGLWFYLAVYWHKQFRDILGKYGDLIKEFSNATEFFLKKEKADLEQNVSRLIETVYSDGLIQNFIIKIDTKSKKLILKVGDFDCMVDVDIERLQTDPVGALEQARIEWLAEKGNE